MSGSVDFDFAGEVAAVTGAGGALGSAVVEAFHDAGATVAALDRTDSPADLPFETGPDVTYHRANLAVEDQVAAAVDDIVATHGRIDVLANIAGTWRGGQRLHETDEATFDLLFDVNLRTAFLTSKHALPYLREADGAICNVASRSSLEGGPRDGLYRASKAGVRILTESIAAEYLGEVRANAVMPSVLDTPMNREMMDPRDEWVDPADVASVILFVCSDGASVTSGASIPVYGEA
ncbi:MAG: SDR family NAD(P)-dependent oxidoreductase [Halobacteriales archaeon]